MAEFGLINWIVLIVYFFGMLYIGVIYGKGNKTTEDYFLGSRQIPWWAIGLSVMATQCSAVSFIGIPGWGYASGLDRITYTFQFPIVVAILMVTFIPFFYNTKVVSVYEYLEKRFGAKSRLLLAAIFLLSRGFQTAVVLFAPALALAIITGTDPNTAILMMGVFTLIYTYVGGMNAVIWTDVIQMFIIWLGIALSILVPIFTVDGGFSHIIENGISNNLFNGLDYSLGFSNSYTFWGGILGSGFLYLTYLGTDQSQVQRVLSAKSIRETKLSLSLAGFIVPIQTFLFLFAGICLFSAYNGKSFENSDYVMLTFITQTLPVGIAGLVTAGVFAAGMSSVASALNSLATVTVNDFYKKIYPEASDTKCLKVSKYMTLFWGVFSTLFALCLGGLGTVLDIINILGPLFYPCMLSTYVLAVFCKKGNEKGCIAAVLSGLAIDLYMFLFTSVGSLWWCFIGFVFAFAVGYIVSIITNKDPEVDPAKEFSFETAVGSELTINNVVRLAMEKKIAEKDSSGYYVVPGKMDKIGYVLIAFFVVQCVILTVI
ncbi:sodium:solute symporter [Succinatimonas hippei]|uniref:sodium:solute symporter n=2 Tax=Succinatimonas hippei TaxID=626938 RepID=UPI0020119A83|nr:sodium:solute symporter [Succinatimonas hippei]MCL1603518.1 sodium:solute symporter [Succinatimonas hippei]